MQMCRNINELQFCDRLCHRRQKKLITSISKSSHKLIFIVGNEDLFSALEQITAFAVISSSFQSISRTYLHTLMNTLATPGSTTLQKDPWNRCELYLSIESLGLGMDLIITRQESGVLFVMNRFLTHSCWPTCEQSSPSSAVFSFCWAAFQASLSFSDNKSVSFHEYSDFGTMSHISDFAEGERTGEKKDRENGFGWNCEGL